MFTIQKDTFVGIMDSIEDHKKIDDKELIQKLTEKFKEGEDLYETEVSLSLWKLEDIISQPFKNSYDVKETDAFKLSILPFIYNGLLEHFLTRYIHKYEGTVHLSEKVDFTVKMIKKSLINGDKVSLIVNYEDMKEKYPDKKGLAWWCPTSFKDTDEAIQAFNKWYYFEEDYIKNLT